MFYSIISWSDTLGIANECENGEFDEKVCHARAHTHSTSQSAKLYFLVNLILLPHSRVMVLICELNTLLLFVQDCRSPLQPDPLQLRMAYAMGMMIHNDAAESDEIE